ncbi:MAG: TIGR03905 family TSCPD domain-containing protein [Lachnospirales bacterium]
MRYSYDTNNVCAKVINFELNGDVVTNVEFVGGCNGNLKAISRLVDGLTVDDIEYKLEGLTCGIRDTSCSDQFTKALREAVLKAKAES